MDRFEPNLRIPGPTALPPSVRAAGARQMINHRGPEFAAMLERILSTGRALDMQGNIHIEGIGVVPDVRVPVTAETLLAEDALLEAAVEVLDSQ
jgi:hypothetical protein